jgi:hypothetical protein
MISLLTGHMDASLEAPDRENRTTQVVFARTKIEFATLQTHTTAQPSTAIQHCNSNLQTEGNQIAHIQLPSVEAHEGGVKCNEMWSISEVLLSNYPRMVLFQMLCCQVASGRQMPAVQTEVSFRFHS